ncbi:MAG TPA: protein kinase [Burkholderiaceae bacterium]
MTNGDPNLNTQEMTTEASPHWSITGSANCLPIGTRLAEFEITGVVGEGGFGNVYLAFDHSLQRTVAIKEYMPVALASRGVDNSVLVQSKRHRETFETGMNSFINEARLLAQFDHPALIKVYRFWEQNRTAYMAMRYYEGQTFKNIIAKHPEKVTEAWLKPILKPILEALETLYKLQVLHRDISPDNIMIQNNGEAVLLDFGAARQILGDMTQALTVILKPGFAPVEQYAEDGDMKQGPWTDIYALSAVMYLAITRQAPPTSVTRMLKDPIELLHSAPRAGFSKEFLAAIDKGMAVKPQDRPQTIAEFTKLLGIDKTGSAPVSNLPSAKSSSSRRPSGESSSKADPRELQKGKATPADKTAVGAKTGAGQKKNVSNKGSWALVAAGLILACAYGTYHVTHRGQIDNSNTDPGAAIATNNNAQPLPASSPLPASNVTANAVAASASGASAGASTAAASSKPDSTPAPDASSHTKLPAAAAMASTPATTKPPVVASLPTTTHPDTKTPAASAPALGAPATNAPVAGAPDATVQDPSAVDSTSALFRLSVKPWANVFVDGVAKGVTPPLKRLVLPEGKHQIKLVNPNFPEHSIEVNVNSKKRFGVIEYDFTAR